MLPRLGCHFLAALLCTAALPGCSSSGSTDPDDTGGAGQGAGAGGSGGQGAGAGGSGGQGAGAGGSGGAGPSCPTQKVTFITGSATVATIAGSGESGLVDASGNAARFDNPVNVAIDGSGNLIVADFEGDAIRRATGANPSLVSTLVSANNSFSRPFGITFNALGDLYVQTDWNTSGEAQPLLWQINLGNGTPSIVHASPGRARGLASLSDGRLVVVDRDAHVIRLFTPGPNTMVILAGSPGKPGFIDAAGQAARFRLPYGVDVLQPGDEIIVADSGNHRIRRINATTGVVGTVAGSGATGIRDDPSPAGACFFGPKDVAIDQVTKNIYVSDADNHRIRVIENNGSGAVKTVAGNGASGYADGTGAVAQFFGQEGLTINASGKALYVADGNVGDDGAYHRLRIITLP